MMKSLIKSIFLLFFVAGLLGSFGNEVSAQTFGNEWINYSQSYAKFGVFENGIYRISRSQLTTAGISNPNGGQLQIFRDGVQVPIYVSANGSFGNSDYIEFYGRMADGDVDKPLFRNVADHMNPSQNLISDTAYYFITQSTNGPYERFAIVPNNVSGSIVKEPYVWDVIQLNFRGALSQGPSYAGASQNPILYSRSSQFETAEGYVHSFSTNSKTISFTASNAYKGAGGPAMTVNSTVASFSYLTNASVEIFANNSLVESASFPRFTSMDFSSSVPVSLLGANNLVSMKFTPPTSSSSFPNRIGVAHIDARYARTNDFASLNTKYFELDAKSGTYRLEFDNFSGGSNAAWLYDLSSNTIYEANTAVSNKIRFQLPGTSQVKKLQLISRQNGVAKNVNNLEAISFKNYSQSSNQGDYLIITDPYYFAGGGNNYVNDYKNFRSTIVGGDYDVVIVDVNDIYNEFGFGYNYHAQAIRNFLSYSHKSNDWGLKSRFAFLIGKGILYSSYLDYSQTRLSNPSTYPYVPIPTFGVPASDLMLTDFDNDNIPEMPIGRLSILNGEELGPYLDKVQAHETSLANTANQYVDAVLWEKQFLHVAGAENQQEQFPILQALTRQGNEMEDTCFGARVATFAKSQTTAIQNEATEAIDAQVNEGVGFIQYFGHGSQSTLAFGFDLPENYVSNNRFSFFMANGCGVGNVFSKSATKTLSERWIDLPQKGSIGFIANSTTGYLYDLAVYTDSFYHQMAELGYGKTIGEQFQENVTRRFSYPNILNNNVARFHAEQMLLQGDPAVSMFGRDKPDYAVEEQYVRFKQISITTNQDSFDVQIALYNLGKYTKDSMDVLVSRVFPDKSEVVLVDNRSAGLAYSDTLNLRVAVGGGAALGINSLRIKIDNREEQDEVAEYNNEINKEFSVYNDDLVPVYPYDMSIMNTSDITLKGSTLNPFLESKQYVIQIDTTEEFNSNLLRTERINSKGGVVKWKPIVSYQDSVVYYWQTALDTLYGNNVQRWTTSSFLYLPNVGSGWNQSHYYQYLKDNFEDMTIDSIQRDFRFTSLNKKLQVQSVCHNGPSPYSYYFPDYLVKINGNTLYTFGCSPFGRFDAIQFMIIDSLTGLPWVNVKDPNNGTFGRFESWSPCRTPDVNTDPFFEFSFDNLNWRQRMMNFLDSIPDGVYVMMQARLCLSGGCGGRTTKLIDSWKADTTILGSGNSLYHKIKDFGFTAIDSLYKNRPLICFMQKGVPGTLEQHVAVDSTVKLFREFDFKSYLYEGKIVSNKIGPSKQWDNFYRKGRSIDSGPGDSVEVEIYGIDISNNEVLLGTAMGDTALSFINADTYPYIRLVMNQKDNDYTTPEQVDYWRVHYQPVPEAALDPKSFFVYTDSLIQGQNNKVAIAIENLTSLPMDSMLVHYSLVDANNSEIFLDSIRYKPLGALDTIIVDVNIDSKPLSGTYFFKVEANPNNDQLEQYHPNNIGFKLMYVKPDNENPLLDVTFDGIHILNRDVVSAQPNILITLKDENQFLALDDTSALSVSLRYPNNPSVDVPIGYANPDLTFIPADPNSDGENKARLEFKPTFLEDGIYELIVEGRDKQGNYSGNVSYKIAFEVVTKSSITSVLNYPNPFSSSTQFVFTLTGSEVPEQFKIQIYSVTGKVVREISKAEIGNIHIGRNITDFRWKGDDQFGDPLGNGVYLYRVITRLNGQEMDKAETDPANAWTKRGFGKLYIMR